MSSEPTLKPQEPDQELNWAQMYQRALDALPPLELPDFNEFTEAQFLQYIDTVVNQYSIDREASRLIKEAMRPVVLNKIRMLIAQDLNSNIDRILILAQVYGYTRTGIVFAAQFMGVPHLFSNQELTEYVVNYFSADEDTQKWDSISPVIGYLTLLNRRLSEKN